MEQPQTAAAGPTTPSTADGVGGPAARYARWDGVDRGFTVVSTAAPRDLAPGEVLARVDLATVCGSDVHSVFGRRPSPAPGVLGHEQVGTVLAVGPGEPPLRVDGVPIEPGMRVVWSVAASCGQCDRCERNLPQKCRRLLKYGHEPLTDSWVLSGGFATHCVLQPGTAVVAVPAEIPDTVAAPASCATATVAAVLGAANRALAGARVLVAGAGMLGLTAVAMAAQAGARVTAVDPDPTRRASALRFGATDTREPGADQGADQDGDAAEFDVAVELSGSSAAVRDCLDSLAVGGTLVLAGSVTPSPAVALDPERVVRRLLTVVGVHNYRPADLQRAVDFLAAHHAAYPFPELVAGRYTLDELDEALVSARDGGAPRRAVVPTL